MASNIIPVGNNVESDFVAYGDDSQADSCLAYAFLIMRREQIPEVERRILLLKERYEIPFDVPLHCRILLHEHPRAKAGLAHLTDLDGRSIIDKAVNIINKNSILVRYSTANLEVTKGILGSEVTLEDINDGDPVTLSVNADPKAILALCMQGCFAVSSNGSDGPTAKQCQIFAAADSTKVQFIGNERKQAHNRYQGYIDDKSENGMVFQLSPEIATVSSAPILQLADIVSYIYSRAMRGKESDLFYKKQMNRIINYVHRKVSL